MAIGDELRQLDELHQRGALSDAEFARAKARVLDASPSGPTPAPGVATLNALRRSRDDRWLGGVCGGLARISGVEAWLWRLAFTLLVFCAGTGALAYLLLWVFVPDDATPRGDRLDKVAT